METKAYVQGQTIFKVGETADHLFIIGSGVDGIYFPENWEMNKPNKILKETKKKKFKTFNKTSLFNPSLIT